MNFSEYLLFVLIERSGQNFDFGTNNIKLFKQKCILEILFAVIPQFIWQ